MNRSSESVHAQFTYSPFGESDQGLLSHSSLDEQNVSHSRKQGSPEAHMNITSQPPTEDFDPLGGHTVWQVIMIVFLTGSLSLVTVVGNILVLVSFKMNKALKTVNNYYLLSLALADLIIGALSMNLYTTYLVMDQWALGPVVCDLWLAIDYVASNASVMNLLIISFDRYFSVSRPLTYRAKRTTKRAMVLIGAAWSISFVLWAPAILFWQHIVGERTVKANECYIQFLTEPIITFCTAIAAFYLPLTIMAFLFWKIYQETEKRAKDVQGLKGSGSGTNQSQAQNQEVGEGKDGGNKTCFSLRSSNAKANQSNTDHPVFRLRTENQDGNGTFCCRFSSHLRNLYFSNTSSNSKSTATKEDRTECEDSPSWGQTVKEPDRSTSKTDHHLPTKKKAKLHTARLSTIKMQRSNCVPSQASPGRSQTLTAAVKSGSKVNMDTDRSMDKKQSDKKAARTLSAILLAFIMTWLPYNIMVLVNTFCQDFIPESVWAFGYWLCYVNSTVNPMCYALCNKTFRTTFWNILTCRWSELRKKHHCHQRQRATSKKAGDCPKTMS